MINIKNIGRFYKTDQFGNLINECDIENVKPPFLNEIHTLQDICQDVLHSAGFHSLYLRGSVPRGLAMPEYSDIDAFAILDNDHVICSDYQARVRLASLAIGRKVDFLAFTLTDLNSLAEWELAFVMKIHSLCIMGSDLIPTIGDYSPSKKIIAGYADIATDIDHARSVFLQKPDNAKHVCKWIGRRIVRAGLAICIDRDHRYSPDLWPCYCVFRDWYPDRAQDMLTALEMAVCDNPDVQVCLHILDGLGRWISQEAHQKCH